MTRTFTNRRYLDAAADPVVVFDGAMGTSIQKLDLFAADFGGEKLGGCNDYLFIAKPEAIESIHTLFLAAGCEAVETDTFRANRITLRECGLQDRITEINRAAAQLARCVCDRFARETGAPRYVAGSIGPTGMLPSSSDPQLSNVTFQELADVFAEQARGSVEGGADLLIVETCHSRGKDCVRPAHRRADDIHAGRAHLVGPPSCHCSSASCRWPRPATPSFCTTRSPASRSPTRCATG